MVTTESIGDISTLLQLLVLLGRLPSPDEVARLVVHGPGSSFDMLLVALYVREGRVLRLRGAHGLTEAERRGLDNAPLDADLPMCAAILEGTIVLTTAVTIPEEFRDLAVVAEPWSSMRASQPIGSLVNVPIFLRGVVVGGYGFACASERAWTARDLAFLDSIASCLSLWLGLPATGLLAVDPRDDPPISLTDRQRIVLDLIAQGRSLPAVATRIGYSESTVKQELRRIADALGTDGRDATVARARQLGLCRAESP